METNPEVKNCVGQTMNMNLPCQFFRGLRSSYIEKMELLSTSTPQHDMTHR